MIKIESTEYYFGILTVFPRIDRGYVEHASLSYLRVDAMTGFVNIFELTGEGEKRVVELILEQAEDKCNELGVQLISY